VRIRHRRHVDLVIEPLFHYLEGSRHVEYLLAMLNGHHPAVGKAVAVEAAIHLVHNRRIEIAAPQEISVQRMHHPIGHGGGRGAQGLSQHLAAEYLRTADVATLTAKQVHLELLELEKIQQVRNLSFHVSTGLAACQSGTPSR
jgi:hypothetical protein